MSARLTDESLQKLQVSNRAFKGTKSTLRENSTLDRSLYKAQKSKPAHHPPEQQVVLSENNPSTKQRLTMTSERNNRKEHLPTQLSAKLTAACSNQSRASRVQAQVKHASASASAQLSDRKTVYSSARNSNLRTKHDRLRQSQNDLRSSLSAEQQSRVVGRNGSQHKTLQPESHNYHDLGNEKRQGKRVDFIKGQPQTFQGQAEYLDKLTEKYSALIAAETQVKQQVDLQDQARNLEKYRKAKEDNLAKQQLHRIDLANQMKFKHFAEAKIKQASDRHDTHINKMIKEDETLMAVYPKITGVPDLKMKEHYRTELSKIYVENSGTFQAKRDVKNWTQKHEQREFTQQAQALAKQEEDENELARRDLLMRNIDVQKAQIQNMVQNKLQRKIRENADKLEHQIVNAYPSAEVEATPKAKNSSSQQSRLSHGEMQLAIRKAQVQMKVARESVEQAQKYPGANGIWGTTDGGLWNPNFTNKTPMSSYGTQFQDPRRVFDTQKDLKEQIMKNELAFQQLLQYQQQLQKQQRNAHGGRQHDSEQSSEEGDDNQVVQMGEINLDTDGDIVETEEKPYFDAQLTQQFALEQMSNSFGDVESTTFRDHRSELQDSLVDRVSHAVRSHLKLQSQGGQFSSRDSKQSRRKLTLRAAGSKNKTLRLKDESGTFETKSLISQRSALTKERKRDDRSLNILTKRALNHNFDAKNDRKNYHFKDVNMSTKSRGHVTQSIIVTGSGEGQDRDKISVSSSRIKQSIKKTLYSAFPDRKNQKTMDKLSELQAKAQLDALKRFIQSMETEVIDKKHKAQEQRNVNQNFDQTRKTEHQKRKNETVRIEYENQETDKNKVVKKRVDLERNRAIPDIQGDEGYPRIKELNKEERKSKIMKENEFIANALQTQMENNRKRKEELQMREAEVDQEFLSGWGYRKENQETHYATSGNLGKMAGPGRQEHQKKERDSRTMKEVWQKTKVVHDLKASLQSKMNMLVNEDRLDQVLNSTKKQLQELQTNVQGFSTQPTSSHSLVLPNNRSNNTRAAQHQHLQTLPNYTNEYTDQVMSRNGQQGIYGTSSSLKDRRTTLESQRKENRTASQFFTPTMQRPLMKDYIVLANLNNKRSESVQRKRLDTINGHDNSSNNILSPIIDRHQYDVKQRPLCTTKSQPAHLLSPNMVKLRENLNAKTALNTKLNDYQPHVKPGDSMNVLERIQSKIEEKMTRADTSNGHFRILNRNFEAKNQRSSASMSGARRCPNLQRMIQLKKEDEGENGPPKPAQMSSLCKGGSVLSMGAGGGQKQRGLAQQARAQTGDFSAKKKQSLYPWEQRLLVDNDKSKKLKAN